MKKLFITILAFVAITTQGFANDGKGYIGISLGPSFPIGDFGSKNINKPNAGLAGTGAVFDISFAYKLGASNFGVTALIRGQANSMDEMVFQNELRKENPGAYWSADIDSWTNSGIMVGGFGSFPLSDKASFDIKAMIGLSIATVPEMNITGTFPGAGSFWVRQDNMSASSLAYLVGAGFKFGLGSKLYLLTNLDIFGSNPEFVNVTVIGSDGSREYSTFNQKMTTFNLSVGLAFKL